MKRILWLATVLLVAGCSHGLDSGSSAGSLVTPSSSPNSESVQRFPVVNLIDLATGERVSSDDLVGKARIINFWASWCATCRKEYPLLSDTALTQHVVGINVQDASIGSEQQREARNLLQENGIRFKNYVDADEALTKSLAISGLPVTIVIDKNGNIISRHDGVLSRAMLIEFNRKVGSSK